MAGPVVVAWSDDALADLNRFAAFLEEHSPQLTAAVADALNTRTELLARHPKLGRPIAGREEYRQIALQVLGGVYVFQYRYDGTRVVILRCSTRVSTADAHEKSKFALWVAEYNAELSTSLWLGSWRGWSKEPRPVIARISSLRRAIATVRESWFLERYGGQPSPASTREGWWRRRESFYR